MATTRGTKAKDAPAATGSYTYTPCTGIALPYPPAGALADTYCGSCHHARHEHNVVAAGVCSLCPPVFVP